MLEVFQMPASSPNLSVHPVSWADLWEQSGILRWDWGVSKCAISGEQGGPWCGGTSLFTTRPEVSVTSSGQGKARGPSLREGRLKTLLGEEWSATWG